MTKQNDVGGVEWTEQDALAALRLDSDGSFGQDDVDQMLRLMRHIEMMRGQKCSSLLASPAAVGWQPIETAPKDGSGILVWNNKGITHVYWDLLEDYPDWYLPDSDNVLRGTEPTLWQPLPSPPAIASQEVDHDSAE